MSSIPSVSPVELAALRAEIAELRDELAEMREAVCEAEEDVTEIAKLRADVDMLYGAHIDRVIAEAPGRPRATPAERTRTRSTIARGNRPLLQVVSTEA